MPTYRRNSLRKPNWDYRNPGYYFVTICTYQHESIFVTPTLKSTVDLTWRLIPTWPQSEHVELDESITMSDHFHGIIFLSGSFDHEAHSQPNNAPGSVGAVIGTFKSTTANRVRGLLKAPGKSIWQRGFYDRIIRSQDELDRIREYIRLNPMRAQEGRDNLDLLISKMHFHDGAA